MLDQFGKTTASLDVVTAVTSLPDWLAGILAGFAMVVWLLALVRGGPESRTGAILAVPLLLSVVLAAWLLLDRMSTQDKAASQRALEARIADLDARAQAAGSALACLDPVAGATVGEACESILFANAGAVAAAVSYVAAQLSLLEDAGEQANRGVATRAIAQVRRRVEADRFGVVAHVLASRDGCTAERCRAFSFLADVSRVRTNLLERPFEEHLKTHAASWLPAASVPVAATAGAPATTAAKPPSNLDFPSSASIPPVNIMTTEPTPSPHGATAAAEAGGVRKPSPSTRQPPASEAPPARSPPMPLAPPAGN